jgi:predicted CopG family antitoxin
MGNMGNLKLIAVTPENYMSLKELGKAGDCFNDVVSKLLKDRRSS